MVVGEMPRAVDLVIVGAGPGGYTAALHAAALGREVVLIDRGGRAGVGGVCLLEGCVPSKALIELADARAGEDHRIAMGLVSSTDGVDLERFQSWKNDLVRTLGDGVRARLDGAGVTVIQGNAVFTGPSTLRVEHDDEPSEILEFASAIIATGSSATTIPSLVGDPRAIDSAGLLSLTERPASLAVVGGGYVGIELGTALAKLGTRVTIVEAARSLLGRFGSRVGSDMLVRLRELGVTTLLETTVDGIDERGVLVTDAAGEHDVISADLVLAAVGRRPNSQGLGLDRAGIRVTASGHIVVDEALLAARNIAAIGDVIEGPGLAHRASAQAEIAVRALAGERVSWDALVPLVAFSDPEAAAVGLTLEDALELGYDAAESVNSFASVARSHISGEVRGHHSVVYDRETGILLGASITGSHAAELISELTIAIEGALAFGDLEATVHPHPTLAEVAVPAAGTMLSRTIAVPQAQGVTQ